MFGTSWLASGEGLVLLSKYWDISKEYILSSLPFFSNLQERERGRLNFSPIDNNLVDSVCVITPS